MNIHALRESQARFENRIDSILKKRKTLYDLRKSFSAYYTLGRIKSMSLDDYALGKTGKKSSSSNNKFNFCYTLERQLDELGRMLGGTSSKFGIFYKRKEGKYCYVSKFGSSKEKAYSKIKQSIIDLIEDGKKEEIDNIVNNIISPMFKGKILSTYFPDRYLNIFSNDHLKYFLVQLNLDTKELIRSDAVRKREALREFKDKDSVMRDWSLDIFTYFLYSCYPGEPPSRSKNQKLNDVLENYRNPDFPSNIVSSCIDLKILPPSLSSKKNRISSKGKKNPNYEEEARKLKKLGDRGEKIVLDMEKQRLRLRADLAKKVKKANYDYKGYDIKSFEDDGSIRYIEVKATKSKNFSTTSFFLSANELTKAKELNNYYIYIVYDILSEKPKIGIIKNPFNPENKNVKKIPVSYRVVIKTEENPSA